MPEGKQSHREHLMWLKENFSDEIPHEMVTSESSDNHFKIRKTWWVGVLIDLKLMLNNGEIPNDLHDKVGQFVDIQYQRLQTEPPRQRTTPEQIASVNRILDEVLRSTESKLF